MLGPGSAGGTPVAGMLVMVGANTAGATAGLNSVSQQMNSVAKGGQSAAGGLNSAMGLASAAVVGIGVASVKAAMTFEQSMRNVNSVAHLPEEQFQKLQDDVISFALTTRSSADNVAKSLYLVASAGLSLDEKVNSVAVKTKDGVVQMSEAMAVMQASSRAAGAGLADVDQVSKLLISTLRAYNMDAGQSGYVTDVFLKVVQSGLVTLPDLANVMGRLAPLAANLGVPIEEVGYAFAEMTQTGLSAEQAATRLNAIFTQMIKPSESLQEVIEKLGYTSGTQLIEKTGGVIPALKAITQTVFESTETIGGMTKAQTKMSLQYPFLVDQMDIYKQELAKIVEKEGEGSLAAQKKQLVIDKLNAKMTEYQGELAKTTPAQQKLVKEFYGTNEGIAELFRNVRAIGGVMALTTDETTMSTEAFAEWKAGIEGSVDAARAEQYKSLETQIKRLKVAFNVLGIEIGLTLIPPLTELMDKVIVPLIRSFLPPLRAGLDAIQAAFESLPGPVQTVTTALLALIFALKGAQYTIAPLLRLFGVQVGSLTALVGPLALVAAGFVAFGVAYKKNLFGLKDATDKFVKGAKDGFANFKTYLKDAAETGNLTTEALYKLPEPLQGAAYQFALFKQSLQAVIEDGHGLSEWLTEIDPLMNPVLAGIVSFVAALGDVISKGNDILVENTQAMKDDLKDFFTTGLSDWSGFKAVFEGIGQVVSDTFGLLFENIAGWVKEKAPGIRDAFFEWAKSAITWVTTFAANVIPSLADVVGGIIEWIVGTGLPTILGAGVLLAQNIAAGFREGGKAQIFMDKLMAEAILPGLERIRNSVNEAGAVLAKHLYDGFQKALVTLFGQTKADEIMAGIGAAIEKLETIFKPTFDRIKEAAKGFKDEIALLKPKFDELKAAVEGLVGPASVIGQVLAGLAVVISKLFGEVIGQAIERLPEIIGGVLDYLSATVTTFTNVFMGVVTVIKALFAGDFQGALDAGKQALADFVNGSAAQLAGLLVIVDQVVGGIYDAIVNTINDLTGATLPSWDQLKTGIVAKFNEIKASVSQAIDDVKAKIEPIATALQPVFDILAKVFDDIKTGFQEFKMELGPISLMLAPIKEAIGGAFEGLKDALEVAKPALLWLKDALMTVSGIILGVIGGSVLTVIVTLGEILSGVFRNAGTIIRGFGQTVAGIFDVIRSIFYSFVSVVKAIFEGDMDAAGKAGLKAFEAFKEGVAGIFNGLGNIVLGAFGAIYDTVTGIANKLPGVTLPSWEEITKGFEFGAEKIKVSTESASTALSTASTTMATAASTASTAVAGSLSNVAGSVDNTQGSMVNFAGYTGTYMSLAAGSTQSYSDQMIAAFGNLPPAATTASSQTAAALSGMTTAAQTAQAETTTATTGLIDGILAKMNGLAGQVTGPQQTFTDLQTTVTGSTAAIQTDLDTMLGGWNSTFTEMATAPVVAGAALTQGWQAGIENLVPVTQTAIDQVVTAAGAGFEQFSTATTTAMDTMNTNVATQMTTLNTNVAAGLAALQTGYATNYTAIQEADLAYQTTATTATQAFATNQIVAWQNMAADVGQQAVTMSSAVQGRFNEFKIWLDNYLTNWLVPSVKRAFDELYNVIRTQMQAAGSAMLGAWLSMLGAARSQTAAIRSAVNAEMSSMVSELRAMAGQMQGVGAAIGQGLAAGISSAIGAAVAAAVALVNAAIAAAWAAAAAASPSRIMMDLGSFFGQGFSIGVAGEGPAAAGVSAGIVSGAIDAAKDAAGIHSPSDLMKLVGWDFVMGLVKGMTDAEKEALAKAAELIDKLMGTITNSIQALAELAKFQVMPLNLDGFKAQVKLVIREIAALAKEVSAVLKSITVKSDKEGEADKTLMDPLSDFFSKLSNVISGIKALFDPALLDGTLADAERATAILTQAAKIMIIGFAQAAKDLKDVAWPAAVALASVAGSIGANIKAVVEAFDALAGMLSGGTQAQIATIITFIETLVTAFAEAGRTISAETRAAATAFAELASSVVAPITGAISAIGSLLVAAVADTAQVEAAGLSVVNSLVALANIMVLAGRIFDDQTRKTIKEVGEALTQIAAPWKAGIAALEELASFTAAEVGPAAEQIVWAMGSLATMLVNLAERIGPEILAQAARAAEFLVKSLAPWETAIKTLDAMASFVFRPIGPAADLIKMAMLGLANKLAWIATELGPQAMTQAKEGATLMAAVLDPWKKAVDTFVSLASFVFRPVGPMAQKIKLAVFGLAYKLEWIATEVGPQAMAAAKAGAAFMADVLDPWKKAVETFVTLAAFVFRPVGPMAQKIKLAIVGLANKLDWIALKIGPQIMTSARAGAAFMAEVIKPWEDAVKTFDAMSGFVFNRVGPVAERIKMAVLGLSRKLEWLATKLSPQIMVLSREGAKIMVDVLEPWEKAVKTMATMADTTFWPIGPVAERIKGAVFGLARKLSFLAGDLGPDMVAQSKEGAKLMAEILVPWQDAVETLAAMAEFTFRPIGPVASRIVLSVAWLALKLAQVTLVLGPEIVTLAQDGAKLFSDVLTPWKNAIETLEAMASFIFEPIGPVASKIILTLAWLSLRLAQVVLVLGPQIVALAKEGAALFASVLTPWQDAMTVLTAMAGFVFRPIGPVANKIVLSVAWLAVKLANVAYVLGPEMMALAKEGAKLFSEILTPWQDAITTMNALAGYIFRNVSEAAKGITETMRILAKALAGMADDIGMDTLTRAAKVGALLSDVLAPWETAMKVADDMRAFRIMPDFVDKMVRFGRQWLEVVDKLGQIILTLNQDGLQAVEDFAGVLTALTTGLMDAMEIIERGQFPQPDPAVWDSFMAWVWGIFQFFYAKVQELMSNPANTLGFDPVTQFAGALSAIMNSLSAAVDLARNFEFTLPDPEVFLNFENWVWGIFQFFFTKVQELWMDPDRVIGFDPVVAFADALSAILGALSSALELARNFVFVAPDPTVWLAFETWVWGIFQFFFTSVQTLWMDPTRVIDFVPVEAFGNALTSILGGLSAALELARGFVFTTPPADQWSNFVTWVWGAFQTFFGLVQTLWTDPTRIIDFSPVESFGGALESIMGGLNAALDLITGFSFTPPDPGQWSAFIAWVTLAFQTVYDYVETLNTDPTNAINFDPEESFGSALESVMGGLQATLDLITNFVWTPPDPTLWDDFIGWVLDFMEELRQEIITNFPMDAGAAAAFAPVAAFGDAVEAVTGGLQSALEFFDALAGYIPTSQTTINTFLGNVYYLIELVGTYATQHLDPARVIALQRFEAAISAISNGLAEALDLFVGLASLDDRTIDWLANAGAGTGTNTGNAMQIIGYLFQAIKETMTRFGIEVGNLSTTSWTPVAQAFFTALQTVIGILQSALDLFTELGTSGMPSTAEIQAFVTAIMQVFTTFNTGLASVTTPLHDTIMAIRTELNDNLAGWLSFNGAPVAGRLFYDAAALVPAALAAGMGSLSLQAASTALREQVITYVHGWFSWASALQMGRIFYEDGYNVVHSLGAGMEGQGTYIYGVAYAIGQQIIAGLNASLQLGSPSRLAMEAGFFTSSGLALGLLAGKAEAVSAAIEVADAVAAAYTSIPDRAEARPSALWPNLSATTPTLSNVPTVEHEVTIRIEGGDRLPKMSDYEMREFARELSRHIKNGG